MKHDPRPDDIVLLGAARTPFGAFLGALSRVTATDLGVVAARAALERSSVEAGEIDQIFMGNVIPSSKDAAYLARHVGLRAGCGDATPALTLNRACGSGLDALLCGARALKLGEADLVLAGGAENMSMTPYAMRGVRRGWKMIKSDVDDMLFSALHDPEAGCSIGETVESLAAEEGITREAADALALLGQQRAAAAQEAGAYAAEIAPVSVKSRRGSDEVSRDEAPRPQTSAALLARLPGLYGRDGVITAGNSCGLNDGAAAAVLCTRATAERRGQAPIGRLLGWGIAGVPPRRMGMGPVPAIRQALERTGLALSEIDVFELNDSFTVQSLAVCQALSLDTGVVNREGGAIALGHPMGATGTRLVQTALRQLRAGGGRYAIASLCIGGGQGIAAVLAAE